MGRVGEVVGSSAHCPSVHICYYRCHIDRKCTDMLGGFNASPV